MLFFAIDSCTQRGCINWRLNNQCAKDSMSIPANKNYIANIHDNATCEVRKQIDKYRLEEMLES